MSLNRRKPIGALPSSKSLAVREMIEDVACLVDLACCTSATSPKRSRYRFRSAFEPLRIKQTGLVRRPRLCTFASSVDTASHSPSNLPRARVRVAGRHRDTECHDQTVLADTVEESPDQVGAIERPTGSFHNCARVFATGAHAGGVLLLVPRVTIVGGRRLETACAPRVATPTSICSTTRRFSGPSLAIS